MREVDNPDQYGAAERNGRTISSGRLVPDEAEANVVRVIYKLFLDGSGPTVISRWLNANTVLIPTGSATKQAGRWTASSVRNVLANPVYAGLLVLNRTKGELPALPRNAWRRVQKSSRSVRPREEWTEIEGAVDAIVERLTWEAAQRSLQERAAVRMRATQPYALRGLLYHSCGRLMNGHQKVARSKGRRVMLDRLSQFAGHVPRRYDLFEIDPDRYYQCADCDELVGAWKIESAAWFWLGRLTWDTDLLDRLAKAGKAHRHETISRGDMLRGQIEELLADRKRYTDRRSDLRPMLSDPVLGADAQAALVDVNRQTKALDARIDSLRAELAQVLIEPGPLSIEERRGAELLSLFGGWADGYYSPRLHHLMFAYFVRRMEYGRHSSKRTSGYLGLLGTSRLADESYEVPIPYATQTLVDRIEKEPIIYGVRWLNPLLPNDPVREAADRDRMLGLLCPPASYSPYLNLSPSTRPNETMRRWFDINSLLMEDYNERAE